MISVQFSKLQHEEIQAIAGVTIRILLERLAKALLEPSRNLTVPHPLSSSETWKPRKHEIPSLIRRQNAQNFHQNISTPPGHNTQMLISTFLAAILTL